MIEAFRLTQDNVWLLRAEDLIRQAIHHLSRGDDLTYAFYKGALGPHLLTLDLVAPLQASRPVFGRDFRIAWQKETPRL